MFKRFFLIMLVNVLIMATLGISLSVLQSLGIVPQLGGYQGLFIFCLFWGMGGAFIQLLLSKWMAKRMMGLRMLDTKGPGADLVQRIHALARKAGLEKMPEVALWDSPEVNAFATGPSRSNSLVAVSTGLLNRMNEDEVEGVLAHEVAHIANGDMVTMTLVQGVINAFVMFFARVVANIVTNALKDDNGNSPLGGFAYFGVVFALDILFGLLALPVVTGFSRWREYRADAGGARLAGRERMIAALERLKNNTDLVDDSQKALATFKIAGKSSFAEFFATHPSLDKRIAALRTARP